MPVQDRLCRLCGVLDDETHFLLMCKMHETNRTIFLNKLLKKHPDFKHLDTSLQFKLLLNNQDPQTIKWLSKFIYIAFKDRELFMTESKYGACFN